MDANDDLGVAAQTRSYTALTGAVGAAYQLRRDLSVSANLGRAFRAPILQELFGNGVHEGTLRFERGDAALTPETSVALDGVVRYLNDARLRRSQRLPQPHRRLHRAAWDGRDRRGERVRGVRLPPVPGAP